MTMRLSRRTVLRGMGTAIALPWLEAMMPRLAYGATATKAAPVRVAWVYVPNGVNNALWFPSTEGTYQLTPTLKPLQAVKDKVLVVSGMTCDKARANGDGPGDHARANAAFLTGSQPRKTGGSNIKLGISADQLGVQKIGHLTRLPSLEIGLEPGRTAGQCDSGYSCAYETSLSWRSDTTPMGKDCDPQSVFDRLFAAGSSKESAAAKAKRNDFRKSVLDLAADDAKGLQNQLGAADQRKVDEYLSSIRDIELQMTRAAQTGPPVAPPAGFARPSAQGGRGDYPTRAKLMVDLFTVAFQTDSTRIITLSMSNDGSNMSYPFAGAPVPHHGTSHHQNDPVKLEQIGKINLFHMQQFAMLLEKLNKIQEGDRTLLDNSLIAYGSAIGDGNRHNHDNLPIVVAGLGGGTVKSGRHVRYARETPLMNLWLAMLEKAGVKADKLGDSTGVLTGLS